MPDVGPQSSSVTGHFGDFVQISFRNRQRRQLTLWATPDSNVTVRRLLFAFIALLLVAAVLYVVVSPSVDLDPTTTRSWQLAFLLLCALAYLGHVLTGSVVLTHTTHLLSWPARFAIGPPSPRSSCDCERTCSRLC